MKRLVHEKIEDMAFSVLGDEDSPRTRRVFYEEMDKAMKKKTFDMLQSILPSVDETMRHRLANFAMEKDNWRAFVKPLCTNYMLAYNYMLGVMNHNGDKVFHVEKDLAEALYHTDIEISVGDIHPPFKAFTVYVDGDMLRHIGEYSSPDKPNQIEIQSYSISYIMAEFLDSPYSDKGKLIRLVFGYCDPGTDPDNHMNWNNSTFLELELEGDGKFKPKDGERAGLSHFFPEKSLFSQSQKEQAKQNNEAIINFIFSLMLYIEHKKDDVIFQKADPRPEIITNNPKKARRQAKAMEDISKFNVYHIGKKYSGAFQQSRAAGNSLDHKVIVRGHWRDQWYGRKSLQEDGTRLPGEYQKAIWIEPFFKGAGEMKGAVYEVG